MRVWGWHRGWILLLSICLSACALEITGDDSREVTCSQGLSNCSVVDKSVLDILLVPRDSDTVEVKDLDAKVMLCCGLHSHCSPCLQINTSIQFDSRDEKNNEARSLNVLYAVQNQFACRRVEFTVTPAALDQHAQVSLLIKKPVGVSFSSFVVVIAHPLHLNVAVPSLKEVCTPELQKRIKECAVPTLKLLLNQEKKEVGLEIEGMTGNQLPVNTCLSHEMEGLCQRWMENTIPLYSVTPCMCFQVWFGEALRRSTSCPFKNYSDPYSELFQRNVWQNVSVSVVESLTYNSDAFLSWTLSAPCRLEAEVLLCKRAGGVDKGKCLEMIGFRKKLTDGPWKQNQVGQWEISGEFAGVNIHLALCVMVKIEGLELGPFCPYEISRWRLMLIMPFVVLLICLAMLLFYLVHKRVKRAASRWHYGKCVQHTARRRHVVLLSPPDTAGAVPKLVCGLGSLLCDRGLSVSMDLWSRTDQCSLGPVPWLHSQLLRLDSQGGRVVLVLTQQACLRVEEWTQQYRDRTQEAGSSQPSSPYSDVFNAAMCCVQADQKAGRVGKRFLLVNFDSYPIQSPCPEAGLPTLLQGLPLFQLPSQTSALLSELTVGRKW